MLTPSASDIVLWLHILAATVWIGGQVVLAALSPILRDDRQRLRDAGRRFAVVAWPAFAVLIITGLLNMHFARIGADILSSSKGRTLSLKLALVAISGAAAAVHQWMPQDRRSPSRVALLGGMSLIAAVLAALFGVVIAQT